MQTSPDLLPGESEEKPSEDKIISNSPQHQRLVSLDVLRGIAILAALLVSIWWFGGFSGNQQNKLLSHPSGGNYRLYAGISLLIEGKMRALIALIFGAGIILLLSKQAVEGRVSKADLFIRRQMWLIVFGLINALLFLWSGDMLFHLGCMGILLFAFARLSPRALAMAGMFCLLCFVGKNYWRYADDKKTYHKYVAATALEKKYKADSLLVSKTKKTNALAKDSIAITASKDTLTTEQKKDKEAWEALVKGMKYDPKKDDGENSAMRTGSYSALWNHLINNSEAREAQWFYRTGVWELACMMLFGMALLKLGFFAGSFSNKKYLLLAILGITLGLLLGWFRLYFNNATLLDYKKYIEHNVLPYHLFVPFERASMAIGYASAVMLFIKLNWLKNLWRLLAPVGRTALSNYLLQSIICTLFFTGFGMTYFGKLVQYQLYFIVVEIWLVQIVLSILWLRYYTYGPAEWLWRCITYAEWLPLRKNKSAVKENIPATIS